MTLLGLLAACRTEAPAPVEVVEMVVESAPPGRGPFGLMDGTWSAWFETEGGPLRFGLDLDASGGCRVALVVGDQRVPVGMSECEAQTLSMRFTPYEHSLGATISDDGRGLRGHYTGGKVSLPFVATHGPGPTWMPVPADAPRELALEVAGKGLQLTLRGDGPELSGTLASVTGDWGPLAGGWTPEGLELSGFDGSHVVLLKLAPTETGRMGGTLWSSGKPGVEVVERDEPVDLDGWGVAVVPKLVLDGSDLPIPSAGPRVVHLTGTWCPNCGDAAPVIERIHKEVPGVHVVALSWEAGAPPPKADRLIAAFGKRYGVTHRVHRIDRAPPFLDPVPAWPTTLFVRADGTVSATHVGFLGPSVGPRHQALVDRMLQEARALVEP